MSTGLAVPRKKTPSSEQPRDRIDLRGDPKWIAKVLSEAERWGLSLSAYLRLAVNEKMERDRKSGERGHA